MATVTITEHLSGDDDLVTEFDGELIAESSTRGKYTTRWMEIKLYTHASGGYVLRRTGHSLIYHTEPTRCEVTGGAMSGQLATIEDLPDEAEPCPRCGPPWPRQLADSATVRFEFPRETVDRCDDASRVVKRLTEMRPRNSGVTITRTSEPARQLLERAAAADPAFSVPERKKVVLP